MTDTPSVDFHAIVAAAQDARREPMVETARALCILVDAGASRSTVKQVIVSLATGPEALLDPEEAEVFIHDLELEAD